jgi:hypothetical protein
MLLALAPLRVAAERGWPVLAVLDRTAADDGRGLLVGGSGPCLLGAEGTHEIVEALARLDAGAASVQVHWSERAALTFLAAPALDESMRPVVMASATHAGLTER